MENISLKIEPEFAREMEKAMKTDRYMTKAEFIRGAIRDKMKEIEKEKALRGLRKVFGSSKHRTSDEDLHKAREKAVEELEKKFGFK